MYFLGYRCLFYIGNIAPQIFMCIELWVNWEGSHVSLEQLPIKLIWPAIESITLPPSHPPTNPPCSQSPTPAPCYITHNCLAHYPETNSLIGNICIKFSSAQLRLLRCWPHWLIFWLLYLHGITPPHRLPALTFIYLSSPPIATLPSAVTYILGAVTIFAVTQWQQTSPPGSCTIVKTSAYSSAINTLNIE